MLTKKIKKTSKKLTILNNTNKKTSKKITKPNNNFARTQKGASILNSVGASMFSISNKKNYSTPKLFHKTSVNPFQRFSGTQKPKELLTINYNYRTPAQFTLTPNTFYLSSKLLAAPHVQLSNFTDQFLLVMILSDIKPKLLWACNFKYGSKVGSASIGYLLPQQPIGTISTILFKLYRYPPNTFNTFKIKSSMVIKRRKAFRKLKKYLHHHNMENSVVVTKQISVRQDKGTDITRLFTQIAH